MSATRKRTKNYNIFANYTYFTPGGHGILMIVLMFLVGALIGNLIATPIMILCNGVDGAMEYAQLIAYPVMFIPAMLYCAAKSRNNSMFETGYRLSNDHYKPLSGWLCAIMVAIATICTSFIADIITAQLPPMPQWLEETLKGMTQGNLWLDLLMVSIMAPFFEEWLCRGMVLRGLLNFKHKDKKTGETVNGIKPQWAIIISAAFFAIIHANPWQAVAAFLLGCLFGYVYYKTGSIKLTMLMHCVNNSFAVLMANIDSLQEYDSFADMFDGPTVGIIAICCLIVIALVINKFRTVEMLRPQGNCDEEQAADFLPDPEN